MSVNSFLLLCCVYLADLAVYLSWEYWVFLGSFLIFGQNLIRQGDVPITMHKWNK